MKCNSCNQLHSGENKSSPSLCRNLFGNHLVRIERTFVITSLNNWFQGTEVVSAFFSSNAFVGEGQEGLYD